MFVALFALLFVGLVNLACGLAVAGSIPRSLLPNEFNDSNDNFQLGGQESRAFTNVLIMFTGGAHFTFGMSEAGHERRSWEGCFSFC